MLPLPHHVKRRASAFTLRKNEPSAILLGQVTRQRHIVLLKICAVL